MPKRGEKARFRVNHFFEVNEDDNGKYSVAYKVFTDVLDRFYMNDNRLKDHETITADKAINEAVFNNFLTELKHRTCVLRDDANNKYHRHEFISVDREPMREDIILERYVYTTGPKDYQEIKIDIYTFTREQEKGICSLCRAALKYYKSNLDLYENLLDSIYNVYE